MNTIEYKIRALNSHFIIYFYPTVFNTVVIFLFLGIFRVEHLHRGGMRRHLEHVLDLLHQAVQVLPRIPVTEVARQIRHKVKVGREVLHVLVVGHGGAELAAGQHGGLVCPGPGHVPHGVAAATEDKQWQPEVPDSLDTSAVTSEAEAEAAESVPSEAVRPRLEDNHRGLVVGHHRLEDGQEDVLVVLVINPLPQRNINRVELAGAGANLKQVSGAGKEVLSVLVEAEGHDAVSEVESFLDPVPMMDVDINIEHTGEGLQKFIDGCNCIYI